ncbi:hypothetical protein B0H13DRAFT_2385112 [Mycena leptocephala]|nr:hypothetical protein B0H13DRAFT_2385112 [Mycena leptocephala]
MSPLDRVQNDTAPGSRVALLVQEGGEVAAYGKISDVKSTSFMDVRVVIPSNTRVIVEIDDLILPSVGAVLHLLPHAGDSVSRRTKSGAYTLGQLKEQSPDSTFSVVSPVYLLEFDRRDPLEPMHPWFEAWKRRQEDHHQHQDLLPLAYSENYAGIVETLRRIVETPMLPEPELTRLKKDIFHAFHMLSLKPMAYELSSKVDRVCRKSFGITFDVMLSRHPDWIKRHSPRYVPPPSIIVPAMEHVFNAYGHALDAESGLPLFSKKTWQKANAVLELGRQGYLSNVQGVQVYHKSGVDRPSDSVQSSAYAKHIYNVDWDYHHSLSLINRISFLLNYLSGIVKGAESYSEWLKADLYEKTTETFGICLVPESLRRRLQMEPFDEQAAARFKMKGRNDWL